MDLLLTFAVGASVIAAVLLFYLFMLYGVGGFVDTFPRTSVLLIFLLASYYIGDSVATALDIHRRVALHGCS